MDVIILILAYLLIVNIIGFIIMGIDKDKSKKHGFRIAESTLFLIAIIGGSIGTILGMYTFRHKTRHISFIFGLPIILIIQIALILYLYLSPINIVYI